MTTSVARSGASYAAMVWPLQFRQALHLVARIALLLVSFGVIAWYVQALTIANDAAPVYMRMDKLRLTIPPNGEAIIGRRELGQAPGNRSADEDHIRIRHDESGEFYLSRVSPNRRLDLGFPGTSLTVYSDRFPIAMQHQGKTVVSASENIRFSAQLTKHGAISVKTGEGTASERRFVIGAGSVNLENGPKISFCAPEEVDWLVRGILLLKHVSRRTSSTLRTLAIVGGSQTCRLASGLTLIALPGADPSIEFGIRAKLDERRAYVFPRSVPSNAPVSFQIEEPGNQASGPKGDQTVTSVLQPHDGIRELEWRMASGKTIGVNGFTAGFTVYRSSIVEGKPGEKIVEIEPLLKLPLFEQSACRNYFGQTLSRDSPDVKEAERCPGTDPTLGDIGFKQTPAFLQDAVTRLFPHLLKKEGGHLKGTEIAAWILAIFLMPVVMAVWGYSGQSDVRGVRYLRRTAYVLAVALALAPVWMPTVLPPDTPSLAWGLVLCNAALFVLASTFIALDKSAGLTAQVFWLILISLVFLGALSMFTLSAEGENTDWERFFIKHKFFALDLLPLATLLLMSAPVYSLRNAIGESVLGNRMFILIPLVMSAVFFAWLITGTQQGLGAFQPVELGKFVTLILLAGTLAQWTVRARVLKEIPLGGSVFAVFFTLLFIFLLAVVPIRHSDFSPLVIVFVTCTTLLIVSLPMTAFKLSADTAADAKLMADIPQRMRFPLTEKIVGPSSAIRVFWQRVVMSWTAPVLLTAAIALGALYLATSDKLVRIPGWSWFATSSDQIAILQTNLGVGRRTVLERLLIWADTRYSQSEMVEQVQANGITLSVEQPWTIRFRDLDYQVLRSRAILAHAFCGISAEMTGERTVSDDSGLAPADSAVEREDAQWLRAIGLCDMPAGFERTEGTGDCSSNVLLSPVEPHCMPVVQSDFAGTYFISRHGLGAGVILLVLQMAFLGVASWTFFRLRLIPFRDPVTGAAFEAMSIIVLGAAAIFALQWSMSWGNIFSLLPVMGQPMTWLSAATSHHLFVAIPAALTILAGIRIAGFRAISIEFRQAP